VAAAAGANSRQIVCQNMSQDVASALSKAKFNDILHVSITPADGAEGQDQSGVAVVASHDLVLAASLDKENGGVKWEDISVTEDPIIRHLRTKIWLFPMLNDERRNSLYQEAIRRASQEVVRRCQKASSIRSLDIGSGTGLLAMMSAKYLRQSCQEENDSNSENSPQKAVRVTSVEMSSPMASLAKQTVVLNGFTSESSLISSSGSVSIDIVEGHSCELPPKEAPKAMLCTSELLESGLLGEGWLVAMRDAWERHLDPNAVVVPQRARVFAQVVEGVSNYWGPQQTFQGPFDSGDVLRLFTASDDVWTLSDGGLGHHATKNGVTVPVHVENLLSDPQNGVHCLCDPLEVLDFDFTQKENIPGSEGRSFAKGFVPTASGRAEGVLFWWELDLYDNLSYSTKHGDLSRWQDHWHQCLYVFPKLRGNCEVLEKGKACTLVASHTDLRIDFRLECDLDMDDDDKRNRKRLCMIEVEPIISVQRCWVWNNAERLKILQKSIQNALQQLGNDSASVLDISDFSLCGMMASLLGARDVISVEASSSGLPVASARVAQIANQLPRENCSFQVLNCYPEQLTCDAIEAKHPANMVVAEPYFHVMEENHCVEEAFNLFYLIRMLKRNKVINNDSLCVPARAKIMACGIESPDIFKAYRKCQNNVVGGFNHNNVTKLWSFDEHPVSLPLYQYNVRSVTKSVAVATLDYLHGTEDRKESSVATEFLEKDATCQAISFWVEYQLDGSSSGGDNFLDTSDPRWRYKQQILLLSKPVTFEEGKPLMISTKWVTKL
jgi:predicted RNA methylase